MSGNTAELADLLDRLDDLKWTSDQPLYRGIGVDEKTYKELLEQYRNGAEVSMRSLSWTTRSDSALQMAQFKGSRQIIYVDETEGKRNMVSIQEYTRNSRGDWLADQSSEVLSTDPDQKWTVSRIEESGNVAYVYVTEDFAESQTEQAPAEITRNTRDDGLTIVREIDIIDSTQGVRADWNGIAARSAKTTPNGFSAFPDGDVLNDYVSRTPPLIEDGVKYYDAAMHGDATSVGFMSEEGQLNAHELADYIRHREDYHGGPVRLLACSTGKAVNDVDYCFAEELANSLGEIVKAPTKDIYIFNDGSFRIGVLNEGVLRTFKPNERRRIGLAHEK